MTRCSIVADFVQDSEDSRIFGDSEVAVIGVQCWVRQVIFEQRRGQRPARGVGWKVVWASEPWNVEEYVGLQNFPRRGVRVEKV